MIATVSRLRDRGPRPAIRPQEAPEIASVSDSTSRLAALEVPVSPRPSFAHHGIGMPRTHWSLPLLATLVYALAIALLR